MKNFVKFMPAGSVALLPLLAFAQQFDSGYFDEILDSVSSIINGLIPILIGVGVLVFIWGLIQYVTAGGESESRGKAIHTMIWGIVAIFVMVSVWGLVEILQDVFGVDSDVAPAVPGVPEPNN